MIDLTTVMSDPSGLVLPETHIRYFRMTNISLKNTFVKAELSKDLPRLIIHHPRKAAATSNSSTMRVGMRTVIRVELEDK